MLREDSDRSLGALERLRTGLPFQPRQVTSRRVRRLECESNRLYPNNNLSTNSRKQHTGLIRYAAACLDTLLNTRTKWSGWVHVWREVRYRTTHPGLQRHCHQFVGIQLTPKVIELPFKSLVPELKREYLFQGCIRRFDIAALMALMIGLIEMVVEDLPDFEPRVTAGGKITHERPNSPACLAQRWVGAANVGTHNSHKAGPQRWFEANSECNKSPLYVALRSMNTTAPSTRRPGGSSPRGKLQQLPRWTVTSFQSTWRCPRSTPLSPPPNPRARLIMLEQRRAGLRVSEALVLESRDLYLHSDQPTLVVRQGKGRKDRVVPVHPELQTALTVATSFGTVGQGRLIEVSRVTVWKWVQQAVIRATEAGQIPQGRSVGTHTLRHSFARHMLLNGIPLNHLSRWLGHGRIQTTLVYLELAPDPSGSLTSVP